MTRKRMIASLLVLVLSAVQVAAWAVALERFDNVTAAPLDWQAFERLLTVLPEPLLIALGGCLSIVAGIVVGMIGRTPPEPIDPVHLGVQ